MIPLSIALGGCAKSGNPQVHGPYQCRQIVHQMNAAPHRYQDVGGNKYLATTAAKLQKDYRHYGCGRFGT